MCMHRIFSLFLPASRHSLSHFSENRKAILNPYYNSNTGGNRSILTNDLYDCL